MKIKLSSYIVFVTVLFISCTKKTEDQKYVAKVGDKYLTENEFNELTQNPDYANRYGEEIIRRWVEDELLFQEAEEAGITKSERFEYLSEQNKRSLAGSLLLEKYFSDNKIPIDDADLIEFFEANKKDYVLNDEAYLFNIAGFTDERQAIIFREELLRNNAVWPNESPADSSISEYKLNRFSAKHDIYPVQILRSLSKLLPGEISIIVATEPGTYNIVQLLKRFDKGNIPAFMPVKEIVKLRYIAYRQKQIYDEFYEELISKYNIEINKDYK